MRPDPLTIGRDVDLGALAYDEGEDVAKGLAELVPDALVCGVLGTDLASRVTERENDDGEAVCALLPAAGSTFDLSTGAVFARTVNPIKYKCNSGLLEGKKPPSLHGGFRCRWMTLGHRARTKGRFATKSLSAASRFATVAMIAYGAGIATGTSRMPLVFGLDVGTTSIGFAVVEHDIERTVGKIHRLGVRIFPEARDPKGVPLNQDRRQARLRRRQLRRRRERRRQLGEILFQAGLLPERDSADWHDAMKRDPYDLRKRAFEGERLSPDEIGRAIYHLAQRRHFMGRDIDEISDTADSLADVDDDAKAMSAREATARALKGADKTLGAWLAERGPHERKRGEHATRNVVEDEFDTIWSPLVPEPFRTAVRETIFFQRPVFWRLKTLGECPLVPGAPLCARSSWLSQQRRMLEKLNNVALAGGNQRRLDEEERQAILGRLQTKASMTWPGVRRSLAVLYRARGESGEERALKFNLEEGGERKLLGNSVEAKLADIFGNDWTDHPRKQEIRDTLPHRIWQADYKDVGGQRVTILPGAERAARRTEVARRFASEFGVTDAQATNIEALKLPLGWEPFSVDALQTILPHLEKGARFGEVINGPEWAEWRATTFPNCDQPTGEVFHRLPSPADHEERRHIAALRNPTVARTRNELRKVVNNLIDMFGKPDLIRVEVARDVGNSKRQREKKAHGIRRHERRRMAARENLQKNGIAEPSRADVEKWLLWQECGHRCPYTGDSISFEELFGTGKFEVEHIWPRSCSLDNGFRNKTLCRRDVNLRKGDRIPHEMYVNEPDEWAAIANRLQGMKAPRGGIGMSFGKIRRFLAPTMPKDFASRQLNDTGYAAREAVAYLKKLWPDIGPQAPVRVYAVSGRVTAQLRRLWGLNNILADDGEKTRADHRHHAVDALAVACCHPGMTQRLSRYWQAQDDYNAPQPHLPPPWAAIRMDAERAVADIVVSHRVRKKLSGPLHKETVYGDTGENVTGKTGQTYRYFVSRRKVEDLSKSDLREKNKDLWPDQKLREIIESWVNAQGGGDPKKAFPPYPRRGRKGPEIRKVRLRKKQQVDLMAKASTGYADLGNNHHIAIYLLQGGAVRHEVVSLLEASRRLARQDSIVRRERGDGAKFLMSLSPGDSLRLVRDGKESVRVVSSVWGNGQVVLTDHNDAVKVTEFRPRPKTIVSNGGKKVSVDPIGRIRPAND